MVKLLVLEVQLRVYLVSLYRLCLASIFLVVIVVAVDYHLRGESLYCIRGSKATMSAHWIVYDTNCLSET